VALEAQFSSYAITVHCVLIGFSGQCDRTGSRPSAITFSNLHRPFNGSVCLLDSGKFCEFVLHGRVQHRLSALFPSDRVASTSSLFFLIGKSDSG
jgi:hypothetical protein